MIRLPLLATASLLLGVATAALAQPATQAAPGAGPQPGQRLVVDVTGGISEPMPIAVPAMATPQPAATPAGQTDALGRQVAQIVTSDLKGSGLFKPVSSDHPVDYPQVSAPDYGFWGTTGASALVQGFVQANGDGTLTVGCYLYDVVAKSEMVRKGFVVTPPNWRRAAHKCADAVYTRLTGEGPYFDSRVVYVSETGPKTRRIKRLAIMDQDGANHRFLTNGQAIVLTPRFAPNNQNLLVYMSFEGNRPRIYTYDLASGRSRLVVDKANLTFAPRFSPDGRYILFSMSTGGNTNIYRVSAGGGQPQQLTSAPGIDTAPSYSPDGSKIVFESDRSGGQQIYVMNADGSGQHRVSFGAGRYGTPVWSPRGDLIAFTKVGSFNVGVMAPDGSGEKILTHGWQDEGPTWSPNGRVIMFFRTARGSGRADLWSVDLTGVNERQVPTPLDGSDPSWSPLLP
jgi:TolB protein